MLCRRSSHSQQASLLSYQKPRRSAHQKARTTRELYNLYNRQSYILPTSFSVCSNQSSILYRFRADRDGHVSGEQCASLFFLYTGMSHHRQLLQVFCMLACITWQLRESPVRMHGPHIHIPQLIEHDRLLCDPVSNAGCRLCRPQCGHRCDMVLGVIYTYVFGEGCQCRGGDEGLMGCMFLYIF